MIFSLLASVDWLRVLIWVVGLSCACALTLTFIPSSRSHAQAFVSVVLNVRPVGSYSIQTS